MAITYSSDVTATMRINGTARRVVSGGGSASQTLDTNIVQIFSANGTSSYGAPITMSWGASGCTYGALASNATAVINLQSNASSDVLGTPRVSSAYRANMDVGTDIVKVYAILVKNAKTAANADVELTFAVASALGGAPGGTGTTTMIKHTGTAPTNIVCVVPPGGSILWTNPSGWDVTATYDTFTLKALGTDAGQVDLQLIVGTTS